MPPLTRSRKRDGAGGAGDDVRRRRKRRRLHQSTTNRKLLVGEEVEVRFSDEGLKGSWNSGVVTSCANCIRVVKYNEMLEEDGVTNLVESILVSDAIEGLSNKEPKNHRGCIRPLPPHQNINTTKITYGMCVDALVNDAWWEGVIMDNKEGSSTRLVFFPDLGDQHAITTESMRLTYDWNEVSGDWKCRGCWVLFDLGVFPISIRQVWYLLSSTIAFHKKIGDWVFGSRSTWQELVSEVIEEALSVSCGQVAVDDNLSSQFDDDLCDVPNIGTEGQQRPVCKDDAPLTTFVESDSVKCISHGINTDLSLSPEAERTEKLEIPVNGESIPCGRSDDVSISEQRLNALANFIGAYRNQSIPQSSLSRRRCKDARKSAQQYLFAAGWKMKVGPRCKCYVSPTGEQFFSFIKACEACAGVQISVREPTGETLTLMKNAGVKRNSENQNNEIHTPHPDHYSWQLEEIVGEYCPQAIFNYNHHTRIERTDTRHNVKKHLVALGWRIYHKFDKSVGRVFHRFRYCAPDGQCFYSLLRICKKLMNEHTVKMHFGGVHDNEYLAIKYQREEQNPDAILAYVKCMELKRLKQVSNISKKEINQKRLKAMAHLQSSGWKLGYEQKKDKNELRYSSPKNNCFLSLFEACKSYLNEMKENENNGCDSLISVDNVRGSRENSCSTSDLTCKNQQYNLCQSYVVTSTGSAFTSTPSQFGRQKSIKLRQRKIIKGKKISKDALLSSSIFQVQDCPNSKKRKISQSQVKHSCRSRTRISSPLLLPHKQARSDLASFNGPCRPRTVLSLLIENNILQPMVKVHYLNKRDKSVMMEGWITRDGIKCMCCEQLFSLTKFEIHSGSANHRPSANIFLEDGRSLLECQKEMLDGIKTKHFQHRRVKGDFSNFLSDGICSVCQEGGTLVLCDHCPASFHLNCVGLKDIPEGNWFCPSCKCNICGLSEFNSDTGTFADDTKLFCDQCECEFHVGCLRKNGLQELKSCPEGFWFCSQICSKIFHHLLELVGKSNPTSVDGFHWSLLRSNKAIGIESDKLDAETTTENHSKLQVALDVLHECFIRIVEPRTGTDLISDILYNKESELKRLNFWGFYTMVLEKEDEIVSVASFRVFGKKVAEMPFVGTRIQYRRMGMCRLLIDELEKLLFSFGVERLLLPAVPELVETWTNSFGFSRMAHSERMLFSEYIFLNFQGTTMCQKPVCPSNLSITATDRSREFCKEKRDVSDKSNNEVNYDGHAVVPEVFQVMQPLDEVPSSATETYLHAEDVELGKNGFQDVANHSSPVGSCLDPVCLTQDAGHDAGESGKDLVADGILMKLVSRSLSFAAHNETQQAGINSCG